jgi:hypothetical protein
MGRRRGLALRYIGEDVTYDDRPGTFIKNLNLAKTLPPVDLADDEHMHGELFPLTTLDSWLRNTTPQFLIPATCKINTRIEIVRRQIQHFRNYTF